MKSILLIDDDQFVTTLYKAKLQSEGFEVNAAHNGNEALEKLGQSRPDVIVLDLNMPGITGAELLKAIRAVPLWQHIPVIVFSSGYIKALVEETTKLGVHKFFAKAQCPPKMLISEIKDLLSKMTSAESHLPADAEAAPEALTIDDIPALLELFTASEDPAMLHTVLLKIYKASRDYITRALEANDGTVQGQLGHALEKLFEDLYAHPEHITESTKHTLAAGLRKLGRIDAEKSKPALESELALKGLLRSLED
ncbi:MAG: response regulator [Kiritimatiellales bacterium]|jgi:CheY-like chemotaxis protein